GFVRGNLDEKDVHILVCKDEVMVAFLAHRDTAAGVRRGNLSGDDQREDSEARAELEDTTQT
ncbi:MAG TPA: hypothetical protein VN875_02200, partial [Candidatus Binatus sp.]|nr:hypothetical protein [Candidatus Binatus sp.]